jgi:hypothetical protein
MLVHNGAKLNQPKQLNEKQKRFSIPRTFLTEHNDIRTDGTQIQLDQPLAQ